jgi:dCMP deaminase
MPKSAPDGTYNLQNNSTSNPNDEKWLETKYPYIIHAEMNCLLNANTTKLNGHKMYVTLASCNDCAKNLSQTGIEEVIYWSDKYKNKPSFIAGKKIFKNSNIKNYQFFYISPLLNEVE